MTSDTWKKFAPEHEAFVSRCIEEYLERLPDRNRLWGALPSGWNTDSDKGACLVPKEMWDGKPDENGLVRWQRILSEPSVFATVEFPEFAPPLLHAYLQTQRVCRFVVRDDRVTLSLPATPTHNPQLDYCRLTGTWARIIAASDFLPIAESDDGHQVALLDRAKAEQREDSPVYLFQSEDLFRMEITLFDKTDQADYVRPFGELLFPSFGEMLRSMCLGADCNLLSELPIPQFRPNSDIPPPFDWEPWLQPEPPLDKEAPVQNAGDVSLSDLGEHLSRIEKKINLLGTLDPFRMIWGAEAHQYRLDPKLLPEERNAFEEQEGCQLPESYAQYLMQLGNGGMGPWRWMPRVEDSGAALARARQFTADYRPGRVSRTFPHRVWHNPDRSRPTSEQMEEYHRNSQLDGTVFLGEIPAERMRMVKILLVVSGPEQGHVWADHRERGFGIKPAVRRGPYSFLAWFEDGLDLALSSIHSRYEGLAAAIKKEV